MASRSLPQVNGVDGSNDDLPANVLVQLSNNNLGGEVSYFWEIVDQPVGTADTLSNATITNPTFTPKKEGTYLIRLTVDATLGTESKATIVCAVRELKTHERQPAAGEAAEDSTAKGWSLAVNSFLRRASDARADSNLIACANASGGTLAAGTIVKLSKESLILAGLPGETHVPAVEIALATSLTDMRSTLGVVVAAADGGSWTTTKVGLVRVLGLYESTGAGAPAAGDPVFVSDLGAAALTPGTYPRVVGTVVSSSAGAYRWMVDGDGRRDVRDDMIDVTIGWTPTLGVAPGLVGTNPAAVASAANAVWYVPLVVPIGRKIFSVRFRYKRAAGTLIFSLTDFNQIALTTVSDTASVAAGIVDADLDLSINAGAGRTPVDGHTFALGWQSGANTDRWYSARVRSCPI